MWSKNDGIIFKKLKLILFLNLQFPAGASIVYFEQ